MTIDKLQSIVLRLANAAPTRYWMHWNYPRQDPWLMAVRVHDEPYQGSSFVRFHVEMREKGFALDHESNVWTCERTNEDGTPYRSADGTPYRSADGGLIDG